MFNNIVLKVLDNYGSEMVFGIDVHPDLPSLSEVIWKFEDDNRGLGYWVIEARYTR